MGSVQDLLKWILLQQNKAHQVFWPKYLEIGVDFEKHVGQGYDGGSTMEGRLNDVQNRIYDKYPAQYLSTVLLIA